MIVVSPFAYIAHHVVRVSRSEGESGGRAEGESWGVYMDVHPLQLIHAHHTNAHAPSLDKALLNAINIWLTLSSGVRDGPALDRDIHRIHQHSSSAMSAGCQFSWEG